MSDQPVPSIPCPRCGQPMQAGFVTAGKGLRFRLDDGVHLLGLGGEPVISDFSLGGTKAWDCQKCFVAVIHYAPFD